MRVPFFAYDRLHPTYSEEYDRAWRQVTSRGAFILQSECAGFEDALGTFVGSPHVIAVANGTDAILLALTALGIGRGDEVILPSHTYIATAAAVHFAGATPVLVECGPDHLVDVDSMEAAISPRTAALLPVQLNGRTADMDRILGLAERHGLVVVEDAAQGVGSRYKGRCAGTFGEAGTYSFYPAKVLGTFGDGGAVVTREPALGTTVRLLHDHGRDEDGVVVTWGLNSRLDNLHAAALLVRLAHLDREIEHRRSLATLYEAGLSDVSQIVLPPGPLSDGDHFDVYQNYEIEAEDRDALRSFLASRSVGTIIQWNGQPVHTIEKLGFTVRLPYTERLFTKCMLLPMHAMLSESEVGYVIEQIRSFYRGDPYG